jgi:hypothetical protein
VVLTLICVAHVLTMVASKDYRRAVSLMFEYVAVSEYLLAPSISIAALKLDLC